MAFLKDIYYVSFVRKVSGVYSVVAKRRVRRGKQTVSFKKKSYPLDYSNVMMRNGRKYLFLMEIDGAQVVVGGSQTSVSPELIDSIMEQASAAQFTARIQMGLGGNLMLILMASMLGLAAGYILRGFITGGP